MGGRRRLQLARLSRLDIAGLQSRRNSSPTNNSTSTGAVGAAGGATVCISAPWCPPCFCLHSQRLCRGCAQKVTVSRWGHTIPAFCRLLRLLGPTSLLPFIKWFQKWTLRTEGLSWWLQHKTLMHVCKPVWCTLKQKGKAGLAGGLS